MAHGIPARIVQVFQKQFCSKNLMVNRSFPNVLPCKKTTAWIRSWNKSIKSKMHKSHALPMAISTLESLFCEQIICEHEANHTSKAVSWGHTHYIKLCILLQIPRVLKPRRNNKNNHLNINVQVWKSLAHDHIQHNTTKVTKYKSYECLSRPLCQVNLCKTSYSLFCLRF